jgi:hypothetical protein
MDGQWQAQVNGSVISFSGDWRSKLIVMCRMIFEASVAMNSDS